MRHSVLLTLSCNTPMPDAPPPRMMRIEAQERTTVTAMIAAAISIYARDYNIATLDVGFSQKWAEPRKHGTEEA